jgi:hypothetical protein
MAARHQFFAQLAEIIDLAVIGECETTVGAEHGLRGGGA